MVHVPPYPNLVLWYQPCQTQTLTLSDGTSLTPTLTLSLCDGRRPVDRGGSCTYSRRGFNWVPMNKVWVTRGTWIKLDSNWNGNGQRVYNNTHSRWVIHWRQPHQQWHQLQSRNLWLKKTSKTKSWSAGRDLVQLVNIHTTPALPNPNLNPSPA